MAELALLDERFERGGAPADPAILSPIQLLGALRRNWPLIAFFGVVFAVGAYVYTVAAVPKQYTASGTLSVDMQRLAIPALQGALNGDSLPDPMPLVRSEVQVLTSRNLIQEVADDLNLAADPEFNSTLRPPPLMEQVKRAIAGMLPRPLAQPLFNSGILPDVTKPAEPPPQSVVQDGVIGAVLHDLSIINDNRSLIIIVQFTATNPKTAAAIVNSVMKHYTADKAQGRTAADRDANAELTSRVNQVRSEITSLEQQITSLREKNNLVQTRAGSVGQQQLEDLATALTRASADRAQAVATYQRAIALARAGGVPSDNGEVIGSTTISVLRDREATAQRRVAELSTTLGSQNPQLRSANAELSSVRGALAAEAQRVVSALGAQADAAKAREADLQHQLDMAQKNAGGMAAVQSQLQQMEKDADSRRSIYQTLLQAEAQTASKKVDVDQTGVTIVSSAVPPAFPSSPRPKVAAVLGLLSGFAFGGFLSLARGPRKTGFPDASDVTALLGIAPMAIIPRPGHGTSLTDRVAADPGGPEAEALRALRTRLRFAGRGAIPRTVLFVATQSSEGAADVAAAFSRVASLDNIRVLLIEGNLREPSLARVLRAAPSNGLVECLQGRDHWQDQIQADSRTSLQLLLASDTHPAAAQLLESMQLQSLVAEARDEYNLVVMDGHAVGDDTHTMVLANLVDVVVLVVGAKGARRGAVQDAIRTLTTASRKQPIVALNKAA